MPRVSFELVDKGVSTDSSFPFASFNGGDSELGDNGMKAGIDSTIVRCTLFPLSLLFLGFLPLLIKRRPLHDYFSNTIMGKVRLEVVNDPEA